MRKSGLNKERQAKLIEHFVARTTARYAGKNHINGIKNFWNQAKRHMRKFNSVPKAFWVVFERVRVAF